MITTTNYNTLVSPSGINALAANTVEDILERPLRNVNERTATICTKIAAAFHGVMVCGIGYASQYLRGPVVQMAYSTFAAFGTPVLGMFLLGIFIPWSDKRSALAGGMVTLLFNIWVSIGSQIYGRKPPTLPSAGIEHCLASSQNFSAFKIGDVNAQANESVYRIATTNVYDGVNFNSGYNEQDYGSFLYDLSFEWLSTFGLTVCFTVGLVVSLCTGHKNWRLMQRNERLVLPFYKKYMISQSTIKGSLNEFSNSNIFMDERTKLESL